MTKGVYGKKLNTVSSTIRSIETKMITNTNTQMISGQKTRTLEYERQTAFIAVLMTPSFKRQLENFLGEYPTSRWLRELAEREMERAAEHDIELANVATTSMDGE